MELRTHESIRDVGEAAWSALAGPDAPPFLSFAWLDALEQTRCVRPERGWLPIHLTLHEKGELVAAAPAYVKGNSEGEFVFDHSWASFAEHRLGIDYFPKLLVAVPFTPATGPRLLVADGFDFDLAARALADGLSQLVARVGASSAHVLFPPEPQAAAFERAGLARRAGLQFHWRNAGYASFDDFLATFSAKRRHQIRRERRELREQGVLVEPVLGSELTPALIDHVYEFYLSTVEKFYWGRRYLCREFFHEVCARMGDRVHVVLARERGRAKPIAGAFNLLGKDALYGRYWGATEERRFLHFDVCFYAGIDDAIARRLALFEPGAGGEHKLARGFEPTVTHSVHYLADARLDRAVRDFVAREREAIEAHVAENACERRAQGEKPAHTPR